MKNNQYIEEKNGDNNQIIIGNTQQSSTDISNKEQEASPEAIALHKRKMAMLAFVGLAVIIGLAAAMYYGVTHTNDTHDSRHNGVGIASDEEQSTSSGHQISTQDLIFVGVAAVAIIAFFALLRWLFTTPTSPVTTPVINSSSTHNNQNQQNHYNTPGSPKG